jgi:hypothetical protein
MESPEWEINEEVEWKRQRDLRKILGKSRGDPRDLEDIQRDLEEVQEDWGWKKQADSYVEIWARCKGIRGRKIREDLGDTHGDLEKTKRS